MLRYNFDRFLGIFSAHTLNQQKTRGFPNAAKLNLCLPSCLKCMDMRWIMIIKVHPHFKSILP
jgi:hypothetical protein